MNNNSVKLCKNAVNRGDYLNMASCMDALYATKGGKRRKHRTQRRKTHKRQNTRRHRR